MDSELPRYAEGVLDATRTEQVTAHLQRCSRCRRLQDQVRQAQSALAQAPVRQASPEIWLRVEQQIASASPRDRNGSVSFPALSRKRVITGFCVLCLLLVGVWRHGRQTVRPVLPVKSGPFWRVEKLAGRPTIDNAAMAQSARLGVGQRLTTDAHSRARVDVATIGQVEIAPDSAVRLIQTHPNMQRLALDRGELSAHVLAPPRLFLVDTPSAVAVDLGCAYTLAVDKDGNTLLRVTSGRVALMMHGQETEVVAGAVCQTRKGAGTSTPCFADAPARLREALRRYDFEKGGSDDLQTIIETARLQDTFTLWNLLLRVPAAQRPRIVDGLLTFANFPDGVTRTGILKLNPAMLAAWKAQFEFFWG